MKPFSIVLITVAVIGLGLVVFVATRNPTVAAEVRDMGNDVQRGTRDAYDSTRDAAEDVKDKVKDAAR